MMLEKAELDFLKKHELCRMATASKDLQPQVTPVIYAMDGENLVVAIDYGTRKLANLRENPKIALVVDEWRPNRGLMVVGNCQIIERGKEYLRLLQVLYARFDYYGKNPWKEGESPILKIKPVKTASWGI
jgi:nitroimidazol reductase NimA-like FMN-containing flavoprotein (pyridoxamine 5'-phosphate oxidase superfamily)